MEKVDRCGVERTAIIILIVILLAGSIIAGMLFLPREKGLEVLKFSPEEGTSDVDLYANISLSFNQEVTPETLMKDVSFSPPIIGEWNTEGKEARFIVAERMKSLTIYTVSISPGMKPIEGGELREQITFSFTTGTTSNRIADNGTSVQLDFIAMMDDGTVFATSLQSVHDDNITYPKSPFYVEAYKHKLNLLRRFPVVIGKETEFAFFEEKIMGLKIGDSINITFEDDKPFGPYNESLNRHISINESMPRYGVMSVEEAQKTFFSMENGTTTVDPRYGWNITITNVINEEVHFRIDTSPGDLIRPYGWDTHVVSLDNNNVTLLHGVNRTHLHKIFAFQGVFPQMLFMVMEIDAVEDTVVIDSNWPPGVVGQTTHWVITVYDIKQAQH